MVKRTLLISPIKWMDALGLYVIHVMERKKMDLILQKENEDGSADFDLTISPLEVQALVNLGLISILKQAIEEGKKYTPVTEAACSYGPCVKTGNPEKPCVCTATTFVPY
jgi:hypothetical protein